MKVTVGPYELFHSGTIIFERDKTIEITLDNDPNTLKFSFTLVSDPSQSSYTINAKSSNANSVDFSLINFLPTGAGGSGLKNLVRLGHYNNRGLYFGFLLHVAYNEALPTFIYSFYLGEEVAP